MPGALPIRDEEGLQRLPAGFFVTRPPIVFTSLSRPTQRILLLAVSLCALAMAIGSAHGGLGTRATAMLSLDTLFAAADSALGTDRDDVDLHDGRSRVPTRWRQAFEAFAASDRAAGADEGGVVFVGSSSIEFWSDLPAQFPGRHVVRRGLAGATMADCTRHVDRLILPRRPRTVVVYAGDNDLASGVAPEQIVADYAELIRRVRHDLPNTRFVFVSVKPSPVRVALLPRIRHTNALMAAYAATDRQLDFVDVYTPMLDADGRPRRALFGADGLHMTAPGYALWRDAIVEHLD